MFFWNFLAFLWSNECWQFDLWFLAFSKSSLNTWKFSVHILLKPILEDFEHDLVHMWNECNCVVVWTYFGIAFLWDWNENWHFPVLWPLLSFPNCWHIECSTFTASSFQIWNSSTWIPLPPLGLFIMIPPKAYLTMWLNWSERYPLVEIIFMGIWFSV